MVIILSEIYIALHSYSLYSRQAAQRSPLSQFVVCRGPRVLNPYVQLKSGGSLTE